MDIHSDTETLRDLFRDAKDSGTPLCSAIYHENLAAVEELLKRGADPEKAGKYGHRPVIKAIGDAANTGFLPALIPLLEAGVDTTSALICAVHSGNVEAAELCLQAGADPTTTLKIAYEVNRSNAHELEVDESDRNREAKQRSDDIIRLLERWAE